VKKPHIPKSFIDYALLDFSLE